MIEVRWHARAGQGSKTASQLLAEAMLRTGKSVQAFPEYGPERRGAPMRAFTRIDDRPIRRHDSVTSPDVVVVLDSSLLGEVDVTEGLADDGVVLVHAAEPPRELAGRHVVCVDGDAQGRHVNVLMLGALAGVLGEPPLEEIADAACELLGRKADRGEVSATLAEGHACVR